MGQCGPNETSAAQPSHVDVFALDPEIGPVLAAVDWDATPLGPPESWSHNLLTSLSLMLSSRFSMWMAWGPELTFFCNGAYRHDTLGRKFPWALGRPASEVWAEVWDEVASRVEAVMKTGTPSWDEALPLYLERSGYTEETYHTFSYSPLRDEAGAVSGMLCIVLEDTDRVIAEQRMATLRDLASGLLAVHGEQQVVTEAARRLDRHRNVIPFGLIYLFDADGRARLGASSGVTAAWAAADTAAIWPVKAAARGHTECVRLPEAVPELLPDRSGRAPSSQALVAPLPSQGRMPYGFLVAGLNPHRPVDDDYRGSVALVAAQIAAGIAGARAWQAQERRAEALGEVDRAKTEFFSNVSHEFRTPLTLINGPVEELRERLTDADPRTRVALEVISRNGLRLSRLVNAVLDFSRIEAGRMQARFAPCDLAAVTAELAGTFRSAIDKTGLGFIIDCPPLPEPVYVDRELWENVVLNLLSNALKFTLEGSITIRVGTDGDHAVVTVADTGIGVSETELPRLFERFHRAQSRSGARSNEGSGIGLALVRELVALHGGTIEADSAEGAGTTFTIRLPFGASHLPPEAVTTGAETIGGDVPSEAEAFVQEAQSWTQGEPHSDASAGDASAGDASAGDASAGDASAGDASAGDADAAAIARVLIVDDNADMREYLTRLLEGANYAVTAVSGGSAALAAVRRTVPDLVISDVMMPGISGLDLVSALREEPRTAAVPMLLLSARAGQQASIEGLEAGADDYLVKPFSAAELLARVRAVIELSRLRTRQARWRDAVLDSLQEAFFACDENGVIVEVNAAFTAILGYGPEGIPYAPSYPWCPDPDVDPEAHRIAVTAFESFMSERSGVFTVPLSHRDGRQLWTTVTFNEVRDPDTGRRMSVGTFRDTTSEHYAVQRDTAVRAVGLRLSRAADLDQALGGVLEELAALWQAERVIAAVFPGDGSAPVTAGVGVPPWTELDEADRTLLERQSRAAPLAVTADAAGGVGVALQHPRGKLAIHLGLRAGRSLSAGDQFLLSLLAGHLTHGLARVHRTEQLRETAVALQRAILGPANLPSGFAVRYEPAARPLEVGGDWYDVVVLSGERIGIVVGDCVGHGLEAATVMGQLRSACRALLLQDPRPEHVLAALDHFAAEIPKALCTTVFCGTLDPVSGNLVYSSAGHPPAIIAGPDGDTRLLEDGNAMPLAVLPGSPRPKSEAVIPPGGTLLLYTDGLVERRRSPLTDGIALAAKCLHEEADAPTEEVPNRIMARMAPVTGYEDDVALLIYRRPDA